MRSKHTAILLKYMQKMGPRDAEAINKAIQHSWYAQMNLNTSAQLDAQADLWRVVSEAVDNWTDYQLEEFDEFLKMATKKANERKQKS